MGCNCGAVKKTANTVRQVTKKRYSTNRIKRGNTNSNGNSMSRVIRRVISH